MTLHNLQSDQASSKVFSVNKDDVRVINEASKSSDTSSDEEDKESLPAPSKPLERRLSLDEAKEPVDISNLKEEDLYERINLFGTLVKVVKHQSTSQLGDLSGHNTYIVYDHNCRKFYIMLLSSQQRYIAVAEDLVEMEALLNQQVEEPPLDPTFSEVKDLSKLALRTLDTLVGVGAGRFNMPWRWRQWSNNYQQTINQMQHGFFSSLDSHSL